MAPSRRRTDDLPSHSTHPRGISGGVEGRSSRVENGNGLVLEWGTDCKGYISSGDVAAGIECMEEISTDKFVECRYVKFQG